MRADLVVTAAAGVISPAMAAYAVYEWSDKGFSSDFIMAVIWAAVFFIAFLSLVLIGRSRKKMKELSEMPVYFVMTSPPVRKKKVPKKIKGKMPPQ